MPVKWWLILLITHIHKKSHPLNMILGAYDTIYCLYFLNDALTSSDCRTVRLRSNELEIVEKELLYQQIHTEYLKYVTNYLDITVVLISP